MKNILIIFLVLFLSGCLSTKRVSMYRDVPAKINLSRFNAINIDSVSGPFSSYLSSTLKNEFTKSKYFKLVSKGVGETTPVLAISAAIVDKNFDQSFDSGEGTCWRLKKTYKCMLYNTSAQWNTSTVFQLTDTASGEVIKKFSISKKYSKNAQEEGGFTKFNSKKGFNKLILRTVIAFSDHIQPHKKKVKVKLFKDSEIPELETGIEAAKVSDWITAAKLFEDAVNFVKTKSIDSETGTSKKLLSNAMSLFSKKSSGEAMYAETASKAYYAYGVALGYGGIDYDKSLQNIDQAITLYEDKDYLKEREIIQQFKKDADELLKQGYK